MDSSFRILTFDEVSSTNDLIKEASESGEAEGLVVIAKSQSCGYGQRGSRWDSPVGGIYLSMLFRPYKTDESIKEMGQVVALGVVRALSEWMDDGRLSEISFKWPNDIIVEDSRKDAKGEEHGFDVDPKATGYRKLCGISTELRNGALCVGIGINGFRNRLAQDASQETEQKSVQEEDVPSGIGEDFELTRDGKNRLVHLEDLGIELDSQGLRAIAESVAKNVWDAYITWLDRGFVGFHDEYAARLRDADHEKLDGAMAR